MLLLLTLLVFFLSAIVLMRGYLRRGEDRPMTAAEESYSRLVAETLARDNSDMRQSAPNKPSRVRQVTNFLTGRGLFRSEEARDVLSWLDRQLTLAGRPGGWSAQEAIVFNLMIWAVGTLVAIMSISAGLPRWLVVIVLLTVFSYPYLKLRAMINRRQEQAKLEMPAFINDLIMGIGSTSGTLDEAIGRVVRDPTATGSDRILVREFAQAFAEYRHGNRDREQALRAVAERLGVDNVRNFVEALIEGLRSGTSVKHILQSQSTQAQAVFEQDMKAFIARKESSFIIGLVLIFFGIIILVMTPLVLRLSDVFSA